MTKLQAQWLPSSPSNSSVVDVYLLGFLPGRIEHRAVIVGRHPGSGLFTVPLSEVSVP